MANRYNSLDFGDPIVSDLFKVIHLIHANETFMLENSSTDLQRGLDPLKAYSNKLKLKVNCSKTKVIILGD